MGTWFEKVFLLLPLLALTLCLAVTVSRSSEETSPENGTEQFLFELSENGDSYILTGPVDREITKARIPAWYNGLPVSTIGKGAFSNCEKLAELTIPDSVTVVEASAFSSCSSLTRVVFPDSITRVGSDIFTGDNMDYIRLSGGMKELVGIAYGLSSGEPFQASLLGACRVKTLVVPEGIEIIRRAALCGDVTVYENLVLPASLKKVEHLALSSRGIRNVWYCGDEEMFAEIEGFDYEAKICYYSEEKPELPGLFWHDEDGMPAVWDTEELLLFLPTDDGAGYRVSAAPGADFREMVIPAEYNGLPVLGIAACGFNGCSSLEAVTFPDSLVSIGSKAFAECSSLKGIQIPEGVTEIGTYAFAWCSTMEYAVIPGTVSSVPEGTFYGDTGLTDIRMEEGIGAVGLGAFRDCTSLKSVLFPDSITSLNQPLTHCESLEEIRLPEGVTEYGGDSGNSIMHFCRKVQVLEFPEHVTVISLPEDGNMVKEIIIPVGLKQLRGALWRSRNLERVFYKGTERQWAGIMAENPQAVVLDDIYVPVYFYSEARPDEPGRYWHYGEDGRAEIWTYPEGDYLYELNLARTGYVISRAPGAEISGELVIPDSYKGLPVTDIDICGFQGCSGVTSVVIPDTVVRIGKRAFSGCTGIREMLIPEGVEEIGSEAFAYCINLRQLLLPSGLHSVRLDMAAFDEALSYIEIPEKAAVLSGIQSFYPWEVPDQARAFPADTVVLPMGLLASLCRGLQPYESVPFDPAQIRTVFYRGGLLQLEEEIRSLITMNRNRLDVWGTEIYCYSETEPEEEGLFWHYENGRAQPW